MTSFRYLLLFVVIALSACKKDDPHEIYPLTFPSDTYYVSEGSELFLYINQGNQQYELEIGGDESVISTRADESSWPAGGIYISGLKKGSTQLSVKDRVSGQKVDLKVHVVDPFLLLRLSSVVPALKVPAEVPEATRNLIREEAMTYGSLELDEILILHANAEKEFFLFKDKDGLHEGLIEDQGHYELSPAADGEDYVLTLRYAGDDKSLTFILSGYNTYADNILESFSGHKRSIAKLASLDGRSDLTAESPVEYQPLFMLRKDLTSELKADYPAIEFVWLTQQVFWWDDFQNYAKIGDGVLK